MGQTLPASCSVVHFEKRHMGVFHGDVGGFVRFASSLKGFESAIDDLESGIGVVGTGFHCFDSFKRDPLGDKGGPKGVAEPSIGSSDGVVGGFDCGFEGGNIDDVGDGSIASSIGSYFERAGLAFESRIAVVVDGGFIEGNVCVDRVAKFIANIGAHGRYGEREYDEPSEGVT